MNERNKRYPEQIRGTREHKIIFIFKLYIKMNLILNIQSCGALSTTLRNRSAKGKCTYMLVNFNPDINSLKVK